MKILILIGMIIVFISAFFVLSVFNTSLNEQVMCLIKPSPDCQIDATNLMISFGLVGMFLIVAIITVFIIAKTAISDSESFL